MLFSGNLQKHFESNSLMRNSPEFPYPIQPDCKSVMEPQIKSREELLSHSGISIHKINSNQLNQENTSVHDPESQTHTIRQKSIFSEILQEQPKFKMPTYLTQWFVYILIFMSLILLPIQISFLSCQHVLLHIMVTIIRMIEYLNRKRFSYFRADLWKFVIQTVITLLCLLVINMQVCALFQWLGFIIYFSSYTAIIQKIYSQMRRLIICLAPNYSLILLFVIKYLCLIHFLNCYVSQCLLEVNNQESHQIYYFDCLHITLCLIANIHIPDVEITKRMQLVTIVSYFYILYLLLKMHQARNDLPLYFQEKQEIPLTMRFRIFDELKTNQSQEITRQLSSNSINLIHQEKCQEFIKQNFESYDSFEKIAQICEVVELNEGQKIIELNQKDDCSLYFILKGQIRVMLNKYQFKTLSEKCTFGQLSFYTQQDRTATIICATNCSLLKLSRERFLGVLVNRDLERFHLTKDQIVFSQQLPKQIQCYNCEESTHVILNCPHIQYSLQNQKIIDLYNQSIIQERSYHFRNTRKNVKILVNNHYSEHFKLKLQKILNTTSISSELQSNSDRIKFHRDDFVSGTYNEPISPTVNGDYEQYGTIQGMLLSSDRVFSLQDMQRHQKAIQEESLQSSESSIVDLQGEAQSMHMPTKIKRNQIIIKERAQSLQKEQVSDGSLNLSPIFKGEQSNPSTNLIQIPTKTRTALRSQGSYPGKTESAFRSGFSSFQAFSGNENQIISAHLVKDDIDQMHIFQLYYPQHNYDKILVGYYL